MKRIDRSFQVWEYWVSHSQLHLRSPKTLSAARNVDLTFVGVSYIEIPMLLRDLELVETLPEEQQRVERILGREVVPPEHVYALASEGRRYLIVGGAMELSENDLEMFASRVERA